MKLTPIKVHEFLHNRTNKKISGVVSVGNGEWSQAFFYRENNLKKVIRFGRIDEDFRRDQFAYSFASPKLPIPKIEEIGKITAGFGKTKKYSPRFLKDLEKGLKSSDYFSSK